MMLRSGRRQVLAPLIAATALGLSATLPAPARAQQAAATLPSRIDALIPAIEAYVAAGMTAFDLPGLAVGIVAEDRLVYAHGFGTRSKGGPAVDRRTVFQIGSATKGFLSATLALMVDRGKFAWNDRVVDLYPDFQMMDPWVTSEFRVADLLAQRSGLPPYANDALGLFGVSEADLIHSLRHVAPASSFRSTFAYTNITHMLAGRIVAKAAEASDWNAVLRAELLDPLGMADSSTTAAAIEAAPNHASGHLWAASGTVEVPFTQLFPYDFMGAGDINSTIDDMAQWLRLQLGSGTFEGRSIVSKPNLAFTRTAKVGMSDRLSYALGWVVQQTPNGSIVWHNGGTTSFGSYVGFLPDHDAGIVVLSNETNVGLPDAIGRWILDRILGNPDIDHVAHALTSATAQGKAAAELFAVPATPRPVPPLAPLAGHFINPAFGKAVVSQDGDALVMELATGARLKLTPWDGDVFTFGLLPGGRFTAVVANMGPLPSGFVQFQMAADGKLNRLRLAMDDGQAYVFARE